MATVVGEAGRSAQWGAIRRALVLPAGLVVMFALGAPLLMIGLSRSGHPGLFWPAFLVAIAVGALTSRRDWAEAIELSVEARNWAKGAAGERKASGELALLPADYLVLNDLHPDFRAQGAPWNWDHVIIGPKGLFVVDAKNYSATRIREGHSDPRTKRNAKQVRGYALNFKDTLVRLNPELRGVFVSPVLAYVNEGTWVERLRDGDVRVLPMRLLRNDILTGPDSRLSSGEAAKIANLLFNLYPAHLQEAYRPALRQWAQQIRAQTWGPAPAAVSVPAQAPEVAAQPQHELKCPACGGPMRIRSGKYGQFYGCASYRETNCRGKRDSNGRAK